MSNEYDIHDKHSTIETGLPGTIASEVIYVDGFNCQMTVLNDTVNFIHCLANYISSIAFHGMNSASVAHKY